MKVYHMSDTLHLGDMLTLDYKQQMELAEPFVQALERSEDCFLAMVLNGKYLRAVLTKFGMRSLWSEPIKWATEGAFEYIRRAEFPHCCSRMRCNYFFDNLEDIRRLYNVDWGKASEEERSRIRLYEIEIEEDRLQKCDMLLFDQAFDALWDHQDVKTALQCARKYFAGEASQTPVWEILSDQEAVAALDRTQLLHG